MVLLEREKVIFVEVPRTGSEAIRQELMNNYGGVSVGSKHSIHIPIQYQDCKVFYGQSNPIDRAYSKYKKYSVRPAKYFLHEGKWWPVKYAAWLYNILPFVAIRLFKMRFESYLVVFMFLPFVDPSNFISVNETVGVIRKESLNDDFKSVMNKCGIRVQRDIPIVNKTERKDARNLDYDKDSTIVNWAFGIEIQRLGYGPNKLNGMVFSLNRMAYSISAAYKGAIWKLTRG